MRVTFAPPEKVKFEAPVYSSTRCTAKPIPQGIRNTCRVNASIGAWSTSCQATVPEDSVHGPLHRIPFIASSSRWRKRERSNLPQTLWSIRRGLPATHDPGWKTGLQTTAFFVFFPAATWTGFIASNLVYGDHWFAWIQQYFQVGDVLWFIRLQSDGVFPPFLFK